MPSCCDSVASSAVAYAVRESEVLLGVIRDQHVRLRNYVVKRWRHSVVVVQRRVHWFVAQLAGESVSLIDRKP
jgi:hypothetical protein